MKKVVISAIIIFFIIICGILHLSNEALNSNSDLTNVGVLLNGTADDESWGQALAAGLSKTAEELNLNIMYAENVPLDESCTEYIENFIQDGCKIIICNSFDYGDYELEISKKYPDIYFFHATGTEYSDNFTSYMGRMYQMRYLSGIVAGLQTETNQIGYVAAMPISEVNRGINAFALGVKRANPSANVYVRFCNTWSDDSYVEEQTNKLLNGHSDIDVIAMHTDSLKVLDIAEEKGIWSVGYHFDNSTLFPNTYLTAPIWKWENFFTKHIGECIHGSFDGQHYWVGTDSGVIALAPFTDNVKSGIQEIVDEEYEKLQDGTFDVFYGPIKDNEGNIRILEGESMSDDAMLNSFDWYVEGVIIDEI